MADFSVDIEEAGDLWVCQIRPIWNSLTISLLIRLIFVGIILGLASLGWWSEPLAADRVTLLARLLIACLFVGYLAWVTVRFVLWMRDGERLIIYAGIVTLEKQPARGETAAFAITELRDLQVRRVRPKQAIFRGCLRFKTEVGTYTFGRGLSLQQANELSGTVRAQLRKANWLNEA